jgi:2-polyprenyl-6-methoxyphenol hydroxylase-like FAD-dependent oxidoreductase
MLYCHGGPAASTPVVYKQLLALIRKPCCAVLCCAALHCAVLGLQEVEETDESAIFERATWDRLPLKSWSAAQGRVVLMGDAAHAMYSGK